MHTEKNGKKIKKIAAYWDHGLHTTRNPTHGPGCRPASPIGPSGRDFIQAIRLHQRGARLGSRSGAYKPVRAPLNQRGGTKLVLREHQGFSPGWWFQPGLKWGLQSRLEPPTGTKAGEPLQSRFVSPTGTKGSPFSPGLTYKPGLKI